MPLENDRTMEEMRLYTAGISDFERIREDNRIYIDKTDLIYQLTKESQFIFLSRPRRFGKTLLCSTLQYYFQGRKDLFEGLKIEQLEKNWKQYPVFRFDISACKYKRNTDEIVDELMYQVAKYERKYGAGSDSKTPGTRLKSLIEKAHEMTGLKAVVIIDEYDSPLLEHLYDDMQADVRRTLQEFYQVLKICDADEQFVFITGITKFSQLSIFSSINNLTNISMLPQYAAICGITKEEMEETFASDIAELAKFNHRTTEDTAVFLKQQYDGYHFSESSPDIYNPFSLTNAFKNKKVESYWFQSSTPTFLFEHVKRFGTDVLSLSQLQVTSNQFDIPTEAMTSALPLLYQSGYLTIKGYDFYSQTYILDYPNAEVKTGFLDCFLQTVLNIKGYDSQGFAGMLYASLIYHDIEKFMATMKAFFASIPYHDHGNAILEKLTTYEAYYEVLSYVVFSMINCRTFTQVKTTLDRTDVVIHMNDFLYVIEIKLDRPAAEALRQIDEKGYMIPYQAEGKPVVKMGISFSSTTRTVEDWMIG